MVNIFLFLLFISSTINENMREVFGNVGDRNLIFGKQMFIYFVEQVLLEFFVYLADL